MPDVLELDGRVVALYSDGSDMAAVDSPRPYLHSVSTTGGFVVTAERTPDHHHHYGLSLAVPDVDGTSHWGGRTYVRDVGSTLLPNHGVQARTAIDVAPGVIREELSWRSSAGDEQLTEVRTIRALPAIDGWILDWTSVLTAVGDVTIGSPATNGRDGAFYGGIFWRTPFPAATVFVADGEGEATAHGSLSPWLAISTPHGSLVARGDGRPWFVRAEDYVGFIPALAVEERLTIPAGASVTLALAVLVTDRADLHAGSAAALAAQLPSAENAG